MHGCMAGSVHVRDVFLSVTRHEAVAGEGTGSGDCALITLNLRQG